MMSIQSCSRSGKNMYDREHPLLHSCESICTVHGWDASMSACDEREECRTAPKSESDIVSIGGTAHAR